MPVTIKDIAKKAGVSHQTVSKILNKRPSFVGQETKDRVLQLVRELAMLLPRYYKVVDQPDTEQRSMELVKIRNKAREFKQRLSTSYRFFLRNSYRKDLDNGKGFENENSAVQEMRDDLIDRFGSVIEPDVRKNLDIINDFINRCQES